MSNKERPEMTNNIDIDLESIPHPKDCYPVPDGATIPAGTPYWSIWGMKSITWYPCGLKTDSVVEGRDGMKFATPEPIIPHPTPEDSPIIVNRCQIRSALGAKPSGLAIHTVENEWVAVDDDGRDWWLDSDEITDWAPAIVTKSGHGIWDERDKRDRVDANGDVWCWVGDWAIWECAGGTRRCFGSLDAFREWYGDAYLTGFADEQGGEE